MKRWLSFTLFLCLCAIGMGQDLQPNDSNALVNVSVIDYMKKPMPGEQILFKSRMDKKAYSGTTDSTGRFHLLLPKDADYDVKYVQFTSEEAYNNVLTIPKGENQLLTFNYTIRVKLPETYTLNNVVFDVNKATLTSESYKELNKLSTFMRAQKTMVIEIAGYTDNVGTEDANLKLSQERADAIKNYLLKHGVNMARMVTKGYGSAGPVADNTTPEGRQQNRRTEIHIIKQ